jgi:hypothetical protein
VNDVVQGFLDALRDTVTVQRAVAYGTPQENHGRTAALWSAYLGREVSAHDVCMLNVLQKVSRAAHSVSYDTVLDIAGYAMNAMILFAGPAGAARQKERKETP